MPKIESFVWKKAWKRLFFLNSVGEKYFEIFLGFSRGLLIMMRRLSYRLSNAVVWEPEKFTFIQKITRHSKIS